MRSYNGVRALVTGHTGFKGAWLATWLLEGGARVSGLALPPAEKPNLFSDARLQKRMHSAFIDIRDFQAVAAEIERTEPEIVFHLAAQALVRRSYADPIETFGANVLGTAHVLEAARRCPSVRAIVCVTTDKCYENKEWVWAYRETDRLGGKDPYSASKAAAEIVASSYQQTLMPDRLAMATARGGNVVGGGDWSEDRLIPDVVRACRRGSELVLRNPGAIRPWQHVLELVRGYLVLGERLLAGDPAARGAWNFGPSSEGEASVEEVVNGALNHWSDQRVAVRIEPSPLPEAHFLKLDISKAKSGLGWRPMLDLDSTLRLTMSWYRRYYADPQRAAALMAEQLTEYVALSGEPSLQIAPAA